MKTHKFTPLHLTILITAYTGGDKPYAPTATAADYEEDLVKQGLIYYSNTLAQLCATEYGKRKLEELIIKLELPYETN